LDRISKTAVPCLAVATAALRKMNIDKPSIAEVKSPSLIFLKESQSGDKEYFTINPDIFIYFKSYFF